MNISDDLIFNILQDFRKKDVHPIDRAKFFSEYLKAKSCSQRQLAKTLDIPHSTLQDWLSYGKVSKSDYDTLINKGVSKKQVYRMVRDDRSNVSSKINRALKSPEFNLVLEDSISKIHPFVSTPEVDSDTVELIKKLRDLLNRIEFRIERGLK